MKKRVSSNPMVKRLSALALVLVMLLSMVPAAVFAAPGDVISVVADPQTLTRPDDIYGNDTRNAGKVTVGKSVSAGSVTVPLTSSTNTKLDAVDPNNFMVTVSQSAQAVGVIGETSVPVDVVFVLDTSGSMEDSNRAENMVTAANGLIEDLMESNAQNRIGVVAFSGSNGDDFTETTTVLSALDHYEDEAGDYYNNRQAASQHITWSGSTLRGRNANNGVNTGATRHGKNGGTNIQAGIARGAQMLTGATNINVTVDTNGDGTPDTQMARMPILVILSDGAPSYSADNAQWWNPNGSTQGAGSTERSVDAGEGFLAMLTAAYYKKAIARHYYGANSDQKAAIYTIGVSLGNITNQYGGYRAGAETALSNLTMNPTQWLGVSIGNTTIDDNINSYWADYRAGRNFTVDVGTKDGNSNGSYAFTATGSNANILSSVTDLKYNDKYWATGDDDIGDAFNELSTEISKKAMSVPTMVTTTEDFSGYVTFTDVLGEYMELKNMVGVVANGKLYQGISFAKHLSDYGEIGAEHYSAEFDALLREVMQTRLNMSDSMKNDEDFVEENIEQAKASANQAYYHSDTDYDNSLVWWGTTYDVGEEDTNIQNLGYADDDSIAYIEAEKAAGRIPAGADCVVRSYFFYGTAGETDQNPDHEYLYFVVRVSRSLTAPYQQTVVISAPASLLSMERVLIREESNGTYTAEVEAQAPSRVIYEVGLRSDINPYNVKQIVSGDYKNEAVNGAGTKNYDAATDSYNFFTNDWNRGVALDEHHRAMTKATFDAAADNSFYRYQENETLYVQSGNSYTKYTGTTLPNGVYYYAREGYSWSGAATNGKYAAQPQTFYVKVDVEDDNRASIVRNTTDNTWYIPAGLYTASTLQVNGDDVLKDDLATPAANDGNKTGTAVVVAHPHRTGNVNNSHYTVLLGNNGLLTMQAKDAKRVDIDRGGAGTQIVNNADGTAVMVGDVLTYTIEAMNTTGAAANIVITDKVPAGTEFVSAANGGVESSGVVTWTVNNVAAGAAASVSFKVRVTEAALDNAVVNVENQATVKIGNEPAYTTNTTSNPPEGKKVIGAPQGSVQVGSELTYEIHYANDTDTVQTVTITDSIPDGTAYEEGSASPAATFSGNKLTWTLNNVQPGVTGAVSFRVKVTAAALNNSANNIQNKAEIRVGSNDPYITTNGTSTKRETGSIKLMKTVAVGDDQTVGFTMILTEATGTLEGTFNMTGATGNTVTFTNGAATITGVKHNTEVTISGLPLNAAIAVREEAGPGWTPTYTQRIGVVANGSAVQTLRISNDYQATPAHFQLAGTKTYVGQWPESTAVNFKAEACNADGTLKTGAEAYIVYAVAAKDANASQAVFKFPERTFDKETTLYYLVSEYVTDANRIANVDYDKTVYLMKLVIEDDTGALHAKTYYQPGTMNGSGAWVANAGTTLAEFDWTKTAIGETTINFTNTYYAPAQLTISGGKELSGGRSMVDGEFIFELVDGTKVVSTSVQVNDDPNTPNVVEGGFSFAPITYTLKSLDGAASKTFTYTVKETAGLLPGVTYDNDTFEVVVTLTKNANNGTLNASYTVNGAANTAIEFQNNYANTDYTTYTPVAHKVLAERAAVAGEFRFEVVKLTATANENQYDVTNEVASRGVSVAASKETSAAITFQPIGYIDPHAATGGDTSYYYMIREVAGADSTITYDPTVYFLKVVVHDDTAANDLTVTSATYKKATLAGNVLTTGETLAAGEKVTFTNHYGPGIVELTVPFDKKFVYANTNAWLPLSGSEFDFEVYETDSSFAQPAAGATPITVGTNGATGADGKADITFVPTHITKAQMGGALEKKFYYLVKEVVPNNAAQSGLLAAKDIGLELMVKDDGYGNLTVESITYYKQDAQNGWQAQTDTATNEEQLFLNTYQPKSVQIRIPIDKILVGKDLSYTGGHDVFSFRISGGNLAQPITLSTDKDGLASTTLTFAAADMAGAVRDGYAWVKEYNFTVEELDIDKDKVNGEANGVYTKKTPAYAVKVVLTEDGSGQLKAAAYVGNKRLEVLTFTNTYTPKAVTLDVNTVLGAGKITKSVAYPDGTPAPVSPAGFKFFVVDTMGNKLSTGTADAKGKITFAPELTFTEARDYHYWIVEDPETAVPGITIDQRRWELHVAVGYDAAEGKLTIDSKKIYPVNRVADAVTEIEFVNTYEPAKIALTLTADKTLTGREMQSGEFRFRLLEKMEIGGKKIEIIRGEAVNGAPDRSGKAAVIFHMNYTYADIGEHTYELCEVKGDKGGVTYDEKSSTIKVTVKDENGQLKAYVDGATISAAVVDSGVDFVNTYAATSVGIRLVAEKNLSGRDMKDGEFLFKVFDSTGALVSTGENRADGTIVFDTITFTQAGKYTLRVVEANTGDKEITYDDTIYTVSVEVVDNGVGQLVATVTSSDENITFTNVWVKPKEAPATGDAFNAPLMTGALLFSAVAMAVLFLNRRKKEDAAE